MKKECFFKLRDDFILLGIAGAHKYIGNLVSKSSTAVKHITHTKKGGMKEKRSKTSPFCPQASLRNLYHFLGVYDPVLGPKRPNSEIVFASGSSSLHTTLRHEDFHSRHQRPSGEPFRKWFFKSSHHFHACWYPF